MIMPSDTCRIHIECQCLIPEYCFRVRLIEVTKAHGISLGSFGSNNFCHALKKRPAIHVN